MGRKDRRCGPLPSLTLEALVPSDHVSRHLERSLDLRFVRDLGSSRHADRGRPSIDPVVFCKLHAVMVFAGLRSERQLMQVVSDCLSVRSLSRL